MFRDAHLQVALRREFTGGNPGIEELARADELNVALKVQREVPPGRELFQIHVGQHDRVVVGLGREAAHVHEGLDGRRVTWRDRVLVERPVPGHLDRHGEDDDQREQDDRDSTCVPVGC